MRVADVELIVKDMLRKQQHLRMDNSLGGNRVIGCLRTPGLSVSEDAAKLRAVLGLGKFDLRDARTKDAHSTC